MKKEQQDGGEVATAAGARALEGSHMLVGLGVTGGFGLILWSADPALENRCYFKRLSGYESLIR